VWIRWWRRGFDADAPARARQLVESFQAFIQINRAEITALQIIYSIPRRDSPTSRAGARRAPNVAPGDTFEPGRTPSGRTPSAPTPRLTFEALKELAEILKLPPRSWTTEDLWRAYAQLEKDRVRGAGERRILADLVSLVRHAALDEQLAPYPERVQARYQE